MRDRYTTEILLPIDARDHEFGEFFWKHVEYSYPDLMPRRYGTSEPPGNVIQDGDITPMLQRSWDVGYTVFWQSAKFGHKGSWLMTNGHRHSSCLMYGNLKYLSILQLKSLYANLASAYPISLAFVHAPNENEFHATRSWHKQMYAPVEHGFNTPALLNYIPNLTWGMFFGLPYVEIIGRDRLLSAPVACTERWGDGVYIQLTDNIGDVVNKYDQFEELRVLVKNHIGCELFFDPKLNMKSYIAPIIDYEGRKGDKYAL